VSAALFDAIGRGEAPTTLDALEAALGDTLPALRRYGSPHDVHFEWCLAGGFDLHPAREVEAHIEALGHQGPGRDDRDDGRDDEADPANLHERERLSFLRRGLVRFIPPHASLACISKSRSGGLAEPRVKPLALPVGRA
jgi:hypothetical protein